MLPGIIEAYNSMDWKSFMGANIPTVETFLASFEAIVEIGPSEDQQVLNSMVIHEASILKWLQTEAEGESSSSLDDVVAQLQFPLPVSN